jgi:protein-S-isoprenylcysteine O-methyltransferase Ste14
MKCNVGKTEQKIRIATGLVIIGLGLYLGSWWGSIGIIPIITGSIRYCPASAILGVSTCEEEYLNKG